ncbi:NYN domain containing protein [Nitzschia inconspicua]|uniref:NYN domain containing protein n=1 Tax=Nitzschia inconspicua TaxID=303405 RepID=A0A9K3PQR8_9STRA|nr:NYN domain containing protein [Nitzschia inconspicua]
MSVLVRYNPLTASFLKSSYSSRSASVINNLQIINRTKARHVSNDSPTLRTQPPLVTPLTSVGIFIDLDNMSQFISRNELLPSVTRLQVAQKIRPLKRLANEFLGAEHLRIAAFANQHTQKFKHKPKKEDVDDEAIHAVDLQEWWEPDYGFDDDDLFGGAVVQTGYDEKGFLRCGVCGAKMKLTKKDRARGWTEHDKLGKHMRQLHDREQNKRKVRLKQIKGTKKEQKFLQGKEGKRMEKYKSAQVGLNRGPTNDWFQILKEESVQRFSSTDVDADLIKKAKKWLKKQQRTNAEKVILVVVSEDSDFVPLLNFVQKKNRESETQQFYSASATWNSSQQTEALRKVSDFVLTCSNPDDGTSDTFDVVALTDRGSGLFHTRVDGDDTLRITAEVL